MLKVPVSVVSFKQPTRAWEHDRCHKVILEDLEAQEGKFAGNSQHEKKHFFVIIQFHENRLFS